MSRCTDVQMYRCTVYSIVFQELPHLWSQWFHNDDKCVITFLAIFFALFLGQNGIMSTLGLDSDIWSNIKLCLQDSLGLCPWELLQGKGYIWPYIPRLVLLRIQYILKEKLRPAKVFSFSNLIPTTSRFMLLHLMQ